MSPTTAHPPLASAKAPSRPHSQVRPAHNVCRRCAWGIPEVVAGGSRIRRRSSDKPALFPLPRRLRRERTPGHSSARVPTRHGRRQEHVLAGIFRVKKCRRPVCAAYSTRLHDLLRENTRAVSRATAMSRVATDSSSSGPPMQGGNTAETVETSAWLTRHETCTRDGEGRTRPSPSGGLDARRVACVPEGRKLALIRKCTIAPCVHNVRYSDAAEIQPEPGRS